MKNHLSERERAVIDEIVKRHLGKCTDVEVVLFGSMVDGPPRKTSDIDIAIKAARPLDKSLWAKIEADFEESSLSREVEGVDYWRVSPEFRRVIDSSGQILYAPKSHPYRICPSRHHWVSTHPRTVPPSATNPTGGLTEVDGHCRMNRGNGKTSVREILTADEIKMIYRRFGSQAKGHLRKFHDVNKKKWNALDKEILFWTEFWNQIFQPKHKLDPNIVKALIASESGFQTDPLPQDAGRAGKAMGLF